MASWEDVGRLAMDLPEVDEREGRREWRVRGKLFAWDRPLRKADLAALGEAAPEGPILAAQVPDAVAKEALLADDPEVYFTTPHFDGYPIILARLERLPVAELEELIVEAWVCRAPKRLARAYLEEHGLEEPEP